MPTIHRDTICALATGALPSAIALIRLSGPDAFHVATAMVPAGRPPDRKATVTILRDQDGRTIDQGVVTCFASPHSYTGEDVVEFSLHGGRATVESALSAILRHANVRMAEPGEFTRRAFDSGKIDLTEAEAVADLIEADTIGQRDLALAQLAGALKTAYQDWKRQLLECIALVEVSVDFPDEDDAPTDTVDAILERLVRLETELTTALQDGEVGESIRDGFRIVLVGAPNAGKSSLLNHLAGRDAAIVTDIPGTTRDVIEVRLRIGSHLAIISDTAGIRDSDDTIEREGIRRTLSAIDEADIVLLVVDATSPKLNRALENDDNTIVVLNKVDLLKDQGPAQPIIDVSRETLLLSAKTGVGTEHLLQVLERKISETATYKTPPLITRARHRAGLENASARLGAARVALSEGYGAELVAEDIRRAVRELSALMGEIDVEAVLGAIFSEFCIGK